MINKNKTFNLLLVVGVTVVALFGNLQAVSAQTLNERVSPNRVIIEEPVGVNDTAIVSSNAKGWISVLVAMLILSLLGAYYLHQQEQKRKNDNQ